MNHYLRLVFNVAFIAVSLGFIAPWLISMPDTLLTLAGFAYLFLVFPAVLYYANRNYIRKIMEKINEV